MRHSEQRSVWVMILTGMSMQVSQALNPRRNGLCPADPARRRGIWVPCSTAQALARDARGAHSVA